GGRRDPLHEDRHGSRHAPGRAWPAARHHHPPRAAHRAARRGGRRAVPRLGRGGVPDRRVPPRGRRAEHLMKPSAKDWKVGDVRIARVVESEGPWDGTILLPNATAENVERERDWLYPTFCDEAGRLRMSIHAFLIESQGLRIIVDTCVGNDKVRPQAEWNKQQRPFLERLEKAGCTR